MEDLDKLSDLIIKEEGLRNSEIDRHSLAREFCRDYNKELRRALESTRLYDDIVYDITHLDTNQSMDKIGFDICDGFSMYFSIRLCPVTQKGFFKNYTIEIPKVKLEIYESDVFLGDRIMTYISISENETERYKVSVKKTFDSVTLCSGNSENSISTACELYLTSEILTGGKDIRLMKKLPSAITNLPNYIEEYQKEIEQVISEIL